VQFSSYQRFRISSARYPLPLFQSGRHTNIQDPGFRFALPWAEVYYAFGVFPRCYLLKMANCRVFLTLNRYNHRGSTLVAGVRFEPTTFRL
jgi:hypothetical protein